MHTPDGIDTLASYVDQLRIENAALRAEVKALRAEEVAMRRELVDADELRLADGKSIRNLECRLRDERRAANATAAVGDEERDADGDLTDWQQALDALGDHGCDCGTDESGTCLACLCEAALHAERAEVIKLTRVADEQTARLIEAGEQRLADEQSIRNMGQRITALEADNAELEAALQAEREAMAVCVAGENRLTAERDALVQRLATEQAYAQGEIATLERKLAAVEAE